MSQVEIINISVPSGALPVTVVKDYSIFQLSAASILRYMYGALFLYSYLISCITGCAWYAMLLYYVAEYVVFYAWHWQAHHLIWWIPFNKQCYKTHKEHHWSIYPPNDFYGKDATNTTIPTQSWLQYYNPLGWISPHEALLYILSGTVLLLGWLICNTSNGTMFGCNFWYLYHGNDWKLFTSFISYSQFVVGKISLVS
jgi:hypothetical protein